MNPNSPITEADLHAHVDGQLGAGRRREIEVYLATRPDEAQRMDIYAAQKRELRALLDPVLDEPLPQRIKKAALPPMPWYLRRIAAGVAIALFSGAAGWGLRSGLGGETAVETFARQTSNPITMAPTSGFAKRAAIAHAVYSPDQKRPVEVSAEHEDQLVAWLSKRMGAPMKPPHLQAVGYTLDGGRLLPGGQGPVAQFMYHDTTGAKLTLYVSNEVTEVGLGAKDRKNGRSTDAKNQDTAFRFTQESGVNVFYWIDGPFGYAISADADRAELARVSSEVYRQLAAGR